MRDLLVLVHVVHGDESPSCSDEHHVVGADDTSETRTWSWTVEGTDAMAQRNIIAVIITLHQESWQNKNLPVFIQKKRLRALANTKCSVTV
eukprot:scaffold1810_cov60-Cyclotella_meneghiniana.AAC.16